MRIRSFERFSRGKAPGDASRGVSSATFHKGAGRGCGPMGNGLPDGRGTLPRNKQVLGKGSHGRSLSARTLIAVVNLQCTME